MLRRGGRNGKGNVSSGLMKGGRGTLPPAQCLSGGLWHGVCT